MQASGGAGRGHRLHEQELDRWTRWEVEIMDRIRGSGSYLREESTTDWRFDQSMSKSLFEHYRSVYFSQKFIVFIDTEFFPGLTWLANNYHRRKDIMEKKTKENTQSTSDPVNCQLYYACARLWYEDGSVKNIWWPWYLFQTQYGCGYKSRNSPSEQCILKCLYDVFQYMLVHAERVISYGEMDLRIPVRFFAQANTANNSLFYPGSDNYKAGESVAWKTLNDLGWSNQPNVKGMKRPDHEAFWGGKARYLDMKTMHKQTSLESLCERELKVSNIKGVIPDFFYNIYLKMQTIQLKPAQVLDYNNPSPGKRNWIDRDVAKLCGESLATYCGRDVDLIYRLVMNKPEFYLRKALNGLNFTFPSISPEDIPTEVLVFDELQRLRPQLRPPASAPAARDEPKKREHSEDKDGDRSDEERESPPRRLPKRRNARSLAVIVQDDNPYLISASMRSLCIGGPSDHHEAEE